MGGQGLHSVTADGNKILIIISQAAKQFVNVLRPDIRMIIKILFPSAVTLLRPWLPILIFIQALFSSWLLLFLQFLVEISLLFSEITLVTVILESIDRLLLQLRLTRPKALAQHVFPSYILIKMAYFNHVDISASSKNFHQKSHLLVFVIIKSALLIRFTNSSKVYTFNVKLVPDKNFRMIAPTVFLVGVSTYRLKIYRQSLIFSSILLQIVPCVPSFVQIGA